MNEINLSDMNETQRLYLLNRMITPEDMVSINDHISRSIVNGIYPSEFHLIGKKIKISLED